MNIHIPKPCHEDWDKMTLNEQGSFCAKCCKTVVDFTTKTTGEIRDYFRQKTSGKTCGRFLSNQLTPAPPRFSFSIRRFAAALYLVFGALLFSSCHPEQKVMGAWAVEPPDGSMSAQAIADSPRMQRPVFDSTQPIKVGEVMEVIDPDTVAIVEPAALNPDTVIPKHPVIGLVRRPDPDTLQIPQPEIMMGKVVAPKKACTLPPQQPKQ